MKKLFLLLTLFSLALCGGQPLHSWNFTQISDGIIPDSGTGTPKLPYTRATLCTPMAGLNCPDGGYTFIEFPRQKLDCKELTFDVLFRLDAPLDKKRRTLISLENTAWRQAYFILQFNDKNQLEARICQRKGNTILKEFTLTGAAANLTPGRWHNARVALASGGEGSLWLDGMLVDRRKNAFSLSDLDYTPKQYYPLLTFGTDPSNPQQKTAFLRGSIASVKMWSSIEPPKPLEETADNTQQERDNSNILVTADGCRVLGKPIPKTIAEIEATMNS